MDTPKKSARDNVDGYIISMRSPNVFVLNIKRGVI